MTHHCDKEVPLAEMHADIKYIKKALSGNGEKGLIKEVEDNKEFRIATEARNKLARFMVGGGWLTTIVVLIITVMN